MPIENLDYARTQCSFDQRSVIKVFDGDDRSELRYALDLTMDLIMQIAIHPALQRFIGGQTHIELPACTVGELLSQINQHSPELAACIIDSEGKILPYVALFIDNKPMTTFPEEYSLTDRDHIDLISSLVGG